MPLPSASGSPLIQPRLGSSVSVAAQDVMHLVDQFTANLQIALFAGLSREAEEIADCKRVGPEITARRRISRDAGGIREIRHQSLGESVSHSSDRPWNAVSEMRAGEGFFIVN